MSERKRECIGAKRRRTGQWERGGHHGKWCLPGKKAKWEGGRSIGSGAAPGFGNPAVDFHGDGAAPAYGHLFPAQQGGLMEAMAFHGEGNAPGTVDHAMPGKFFPVRKRMEDPDNLARAPGAAGQGRDLAVGGDFAFGDPFENGDDAFRERGEGSGISDRGEGRVSGSWP